MTGIIIQLLISWLLLWIIEKKDLSALGLKPTRLRIQHAFWGLLIAILFVALYWYAVSLITNNPYKLNSAYDLTDFFKGTWFVLNSVLFEELIFRGALLYILMKRIGATKGILISAAGFGIYHWFSYGILGQPIMMLFIFTITGVAGYIFALAFKITGSMYLPIALHFGYNFSNMIIFSNAKSIGTQLLTKTMEGDTFYSSTFLWILMTIINAVGFPIIAYLYLNKLKPANS